MQLDLPYLAIVFAVIIVMPNLKQKIKGRKRKMSLSVAILTGTLAAASSSARLCQTQNTTSQKGLGV